MDTEKYVPPFSSRDITASIRMVATPRMTASRAARSRDVGLLVNVRIIGVMVWKSRPPRTCGALRAPSPVRKDRMVTANSVGFSMGSTIRRRMVHVEAPRFLAASMVW